jgi:hypothetical protein
MFAKPKSPVFIDSMVFEVDRNEVPSSLRAVLKDEKGSIIISMEAEIPQGHTKFSWRGLNDVPYGIYVLELYNGESETRMRMVKRV